MNRNYINTLLDGLTNYTRLGVNESTEMKMARQLTNEEVTKNPNFKNLYSVLQTVGKIKKGENHQKELKHNFEINPLTLENGIFSASNNSKGNLDVLLEKFRADYKIVSDNLKDEALEYSLFHLLYQYGTRIAFEAHNEKAVNTSELKTDVSLFDRNRILAGITTCLEKPNIDTDQPFLLIKGDLSGIQGFIYYDIVQDITESGGAKKIAKKLRGRSFYIALFTQFLAEEIVESLNLTQSNIIFAGGGHFNIVLPNTPEINQQLEKLEQKINTFIRNKVGSSLSLILGVQPCREDLFTNTNVYYAKMNHTLEMTRQQKHKSYLTDIFHPPVALKRKVALKEDEQLGQQIPYASQMIEIKFKPNHKPLDKGKFKPILSFDDFNKYIFFDKLEHKSDYTQNQFIKNLLLEYKEQIESVKIIAINNTTFVNKTLILEYLKDFTFPIAFGFQLIGKEAPMNENETELLDFKEISELDYSNPNKKLGYTQLAAMRLDVDDLGAIFTSGLEPMSFQRVASLSREFHLFFSGYINELAKKYQIYIVYSGGDDAFVVGSWYNMIHFAKGLHEDFKKFACNNENVHFSAGIFLCHENYPVARFADDAARLEELAKKYKNTQEKIIKNAVHIFDYTLSWENFVSMIDFAEKTLKHTNYEGVKEKGKLNRSLIHRLLNLIKSSTKNNIIHAGKLNRNKAMLHYLFARHGYNQEKFEQATDELTKDVIHQILKDFSNETKIQDYLIATSYVLLKTRKNSN